MKAENIFIQRRISGILRSLNGLLKNIEDFRKEYPYAIAPNLLDVLIENLKENAQILYRELNRVGSAQREHPVQRRYVCRSCHRVFMAQLVAGICDECRALGITTDELSRAVTPPPEEAASFVSEKHNSGSKPSEQTTGAEQHQPADQVKPPEPGEEQIAPAQVSTQDPFQQREAPPESAGAEQKPENT